MIALLFWLALNQGQALTKAQTIWGPDAQVHKQPLGHGIFDYQVGCTLNGKFQAVGHSLVNWEMSFATVDLGKNGKRIVSAIAYDTLGNFSTAEPIILWFCNP